MKQYCDCVALGAYNCVLHNYQWEIFHATLEGNIIAYFEIGCRKTLIAIQLMKQIAHKGRASRKQNLRMFFAPTIQLVKQVSCSIGTSFFIWAESKCKTYHFRELIIHILWTVQQAEVIRKNTDFKDSTNYDQSDNV